MEFKDLLHILLQNGSDGSKVLHLKKMHYPENLMKNAIHFKK